MKAANEYTTAYVFAPLPGGETICAGKIELFGTHGAFRYNPEWAENPRAYAFDPMNLPLTDKVQLTQNRTKVHNVFSDSAPDMWGEKILLLKHKSQPKNEAERLMRLSGCGVGVLHYSLSRSTYKVSPSLPQIDLLQTLALPIEKLANEQLISREDLALLEPGSSMGGARPKITVSGSEGREWLVKFSKQNDIVNLPMVEFATMSLLSKAGLRVPNIGIERLNNGKNCFLIERFDRVPHRCHFISAHSLFGVDRVRSYGNGYDDPAGYIALAGILRKVSSKPVEDCLELFRRIIASVLVGNTDDHARNHAMVYDLVDETWRLSPVYDVVPVFGAQEQAMSIGKLGRSGTMENIVSAAPAFGIKPKEANEMIMEMKTAIENWEEHFIDCGVSELDIELLRSKIKTE